MLLNKNSPECEGERNTRVSIGHYPSNVVRMRGRGVAWMDRLLLRKTNYMLVY